jgi:regulatory protein
LAGTLYARALRLLARREHTRAELAAKLRASGQEPEEIERLLDDLQNRGWLSEARYVESVVHARRARFGAVRITQELRRKGVSEDAVKRAAQSLAADELEAAREVWRRKFGTLPANLAEKARQARFLAARGFSAETVKRVLDRRGD